MPSLLNTDTWKLKELKEGKSQEAVGSKSLAIKYTKVVNKKI
jgi:hypothetical protein